MDINLQYIKNNFLEWSEVCKRCNLRTGQLEQLIALELCPAPSYTIKSDHQIASPLGDSVTVTETSRFFPKHIIGLIKENLSLPDASSFKEKLKAAFIKTLEESNDLQYPYGGIADTQGRLDLQKANLMFEEEWKYYCMGIYGICTLNATGADIAKKEIAVKKLIQFNERHADKPLNGLKKEQLKELQVEYDAVSNLFAPYQRATSSRGKYLDKVLNANGLGSKIKNY